ncbi:MAG: hypothetical protein AAF675_15135 [Pseudomonadota bacterium]
MILCSCTLLKSAALTDAIETALDRDPQAVLTPGRVFHQTGRRIECGRCCALVNQRIARELERLRPATPDRKGRDR